MKQKRTLLATTITLLLFTLALTTTTATDAKLKSPLTHPEYNWGSAANATITYGLPWYAVDPWEIEVCTRGLTSMTGSDRTGTSNIIDFNLQNPIYRDTITILAIHRKTNNLDYYEVGWYVQPYEDTLEVKVNLTAANGDERTLGEETVQPANSFSKYLAFPVPCDDELYSFCTGLDGQPVTVRIEWRTVVGENKGPVQYLTSTFVNAGEQDTKQEV